MRIAIFLLCVSFAHAATWSKFDGVTVGAAAGNVSKLNGVSIGTATSNYNSWNGLTSPSAGPVLSVVQSTKANGNFSSVSVTLVYSTAPTTGDLLVAGVTGFAAITPPAGWTLIDSQTNAGMTFSDYQHVVGVAEPNSYTFLVATTNACSAIGYDVQNQNATPVDQHSIVNGQTNFSVVTTGITPTVLGDLALSFMSFETYMDPIDVSTGWTLDQLANATVIGDTAGSARTALTSDTITPITNTLQDRFMGDIHPVIGAAVLIKP